MKRFTIEDIRSWKPCYDPARHLVDDWSGIVLDILAHSTITPSDKLWVVCRDELINAKTMRLFAVWCARSVPQTSLECIAAIDTAERHANGSASDEELSAAWSAAWSAAMFAAESAARSAAMSAAHAAWFAARSAAWSAAMSAAESAAHAAMSAAHAARAAQIDQLQKMLILNQPQSRRSFLIHDR